VHCGGAARSTRFVPVQGWPLSAALTVDQAIDNPSSYAAFVQEITFGGNDMRFGAGRPQD
jgi:hypothetical protein